LMLKYLHTEDFSVIQYVDQRVYRKFLCWDLIVTKDSHVFNMPKEKCKTVFWKNAILLMFIVQ
jgi:hypothetical protein